MIDIILQLIYAFVGSFGFALLYNIKLKRILPCSLGGMLAWGVYLAINHLMHNLFFAVFLASAFASFYSEISARVLKAPTTIFTIPALIPLVPGSSLFYTMQNAVLNHWDNVSYYALETVTFIGAITLGLSIVSALFKMFTKKKTVE
ncbi:MAG: threonine/serine exporter [Clostridiales bacterium]|nr:threonine/serine exporter [Clostridiales bacterium]